MRPQRAGDELQEGEDARGARLGGGGGGGGEGGGAVEEEWEEALAEGEALDGESARVGLVSRRMLQLQRREHEKTGGSRGGGVYRLSRSCIPVTRFCA